MNLYLSRLTIERYRGNKRSGLERTRASGESVLTAVSRDVYLLGAAVAQCNCSMERSERFANVHTQKTRKTRGGTAERPQGALRCALLLQDLHHFAYDTV